MIDWETDMVTQAQQRVLDFWAAAAYAPVPRPTRSLMRIVTYDVKLETLEVEDQHGRVMFGPADIPKNRKKHFSFEEVAKIPVLPNRQWVLVEDRLGVPKLLRHARNIEVTNQTYTYAPSYGDACGGYSILHRIRLFHDDGSVVEQMKTYYNGNTRSFRIAAIAKRHLKPGIRAVEIEIPENSPGYYGTLLNPGRILPQARVTVDPVGTEVVREDWDEKASAWALHA